MLRKLILIVLILITFLGLVGCLEEPEYIMFNPHKEIPRPANISAEVLDAFTLRVVWNVKNRQNIDQFEIHFIDSLSQDSVSYDDSQWKTLILNSDTVGTEVINEDSARFWHDFSQLSYGENCAFYVVSQYNKESRGILSSDTSDITSLRFIIPEPSVTDTNITRGQIGLQIRSNLPGTHPELNEGFELKRVTGTDTVIQTIALKGSNNVTFFDSLYVIKDSLVAGYSDSIYQYFDIKPNVNYTYLITHHQEKDSDIRYSDSIQIDSLAIPKDLLSLEAVRPKSATEVRYYMASDYTEPSRLASDYDRFLLYTKSSETSPWELYQSIKVDSACYYDYLSQYLLDIQGFEKDSSTTRIIAMDDANRWVKVSNDLEANSLNIYGFQLVEAGEFTFSVTGKDTVLDRFYLSQFEVTNTLYGDSGLWEEPIKKKTAKSMVSWNDADAYCRGLNQISTFSSDYEFSLPSEVEWEYAARRDYRNSSTLYQYPWSSDDIDYYHANYNDNYGSVLPVGEFPYHTVHLLYDMAGNVQEWVKAHDDGNLPTGYSVARGGYYLSSAELVKSTSRKSLPMETKADGLGFRVAMELK